MNKPDKFIGICLITDDSFQHKPVTFALDGGHIVAEPEPTPLQGYIKFVAVVGHIFIKIHNTPVEFAHVLNNGFGYETSFEEILQDAFRYPLDILDIAPATRQLFDEIRIYQFEGH